MNRNDQDARLMAAESAESIVPGPDQSAVEIDLDDAEWYLNRELTWLEFNRRVLHEAEDSRNPLLERVKFLAILSSNLDEFFMKRIGGLKQQIGAGADAPGRYQDIPVSRAVARATGGCPPVLR
jgi:polyphosphate kinase